MPAGYPGSPAPGLPPSPLPLLAPASPGPRRKGRGWLAYSAVAAVLIVAAAVVVGVHIASQGSALPESVPTASTTPTRSVSSSARPRRVGHSSVGHSSVGHGPASVVRAYYKALNNGDFAKAWALGGKNLGQNFAAFVAGFAQDANIGIMSLTATGNTVTAKTHAVELDGETKVLSLTYTVVNGVITAVSDHAS